MARHGRATVPFGRSRGVEVRYLSDYDLCSLCAWLTAEESRAQKFEYLLESIKSEMRHRGMNADAAEEIDASEPSTPSTEQLTLSLAAQRKVTRKYCFEEL